MIEKRKKFGAFILPLFVITLGITNYTRLTGTENIRAIHIVTLLTIGMAIGVLIRNLLTHFAKEKKSDEHMIH
jgi:glucose uptake protein GlcU